MPILLTVASVRRIEESVRLSCKESASVAQRETRLQTDLASGPVSPNHINFGIAGHLSTRRFRLDDQNLLLCEGAG
jgi:hypothetical protein